MQDERIKQAIRASVRETMQLCMNAKPADRERNRALAVEYAEMLILPAAAAAVRAALEQAGVA